MESQIQNSIIETIGATPLVALERLCHDLPGRVLLKIEYFNPGFSIKDRIARQIIEDAEKDGRLKPGSTVIELTSGNTGTGLAVVCGVKGYRLICVMSEGNTPERARMMRALGAEVVLVPQLKDSKLGQVSGADLAEVERVTQELTHKYNAFRADQFNNPSNLTAHQITGEEIWQQSGGKVDAFISIAGSGGTFGGVSRILKKYNPDVRCYLVEPAGAPYLAGKPITQPNHKIQGAGYMMDLPKVPRDLVEEYLTVTDDEAVETARQLAKKEGIFGGFSTGANVAAALRLAREANPGEVLVTTAGDSGLKYLSTDLYNR